MTYTILDQYQCAAGYDYVISVIDATGAAVTQILHSCDGQQVDADVWIQGVLAAQQAAQQQQQQAQPTDPTQGN